VFKLEEKNMDLSLELDNERKLKQTISSAKDAISYKVESAAKNTKDAFVGLFR
jgi:hypothetical protein